MDLLPPDLDFKRGAVILFALHGLVLSELLSLSPLSPKERRDLVEELLRRFPDYTIDEAGGERATSEFQIGWVRLPIVVHSQGKAA